MTTLNVETEWAKVTANYETNKSKKADIIVIGHSGVGKTHLLRTCPQPVYVDSFDKGGSRGVLSDMIDQGRIAVDDRWEIDDGLNPTAFKGWDDNFTRLMRSNFFDSIGTYAVDSMTSLSDAIMRKVLKDAGRANKKPDFYEDYPAHHRIIRDAIMMIWSLPCYTILTGHIDVMQDSITGGIISSLMLPGKSAAKVPIHADEVYILEVKETKEGLERTLLTHNTGKLRARTRMGSRKFDIREPANIRALIKKAGFNADDKPLIK